MTVLVRLEPGPLGPRLVEADPLALDPHDVVGLVRHGVVFVGRWERLRRLHDHA